MSKRPTAISLASLPEGYHADHIVPGLAFRVGKKRRTWTFRYRKGGGGEARDTLGYFLGVNPPEGSDHMGLGEARDEARRRIERINAGVPTAEKPAHPKQGGQTVADIIDAYEAMRRLKAERNKTLDNALRTIRSGLADYLKVPASQFSKSDLRAARDKIAKRAPYQANRFLAYLGPCWKWAASEDHVPVNFVPDVLKTTSENKRERILTHEEIVSVWNAAIDLKGSRRDAAENYGRLIRFLLVTGQRLDNGASLRHGDILDGTWHQMENKASRPIKIKLPKLALDIVGSGEARDLVFPGVNGKLSGYSRLKADLDEACGVEGWVFHDLRRSFASEMQTLGVDEMIIRALLNHAVPGVAQNYFRAALDEGKTKALADWATELERIVGKRSQTARPYAPKQTPLLAVKANQGKGAQK